MGTTSMDSIESRLDVEELFDIEEFDALLPPLDTLEMASLVSFPLMIP